MAEADIAVLGTSNVEAGVPKWQAVVPLTDDTGDVDSLGEIDVIQSLGISSLPYGKDGDGYAEGIFLRDCGGRSAICIGARDTRSAKVVGNLKPGDTVLHSTGPSQSAQVQCKEEKRQVVLVTKGTNDKGIMIVLDGKNDKIQITGFGSTLEMSKDGIFMTDGTASISIEGGTINLNGDIKIPGIPPQMALVCALPVPQGPGPLVNPLAPVMGVGGFT